MGAYTPPFQITNEILSYVASVSEKIGKLSAISSLESKPHLRRNNRIKSIHSSLKIEANSLTLGQVRDVINGKLVLGEQREIQEVKNAYAAYEKMTEIDIYSIKKLKEFHGIMTKYVVEEAGKFRQGEEGVFHYELVFIHPFSDGNGRMARLWHTAILSKWKPIFEYIPLESQIEKFQDDYYDAIAKCHVQGESTIFIEFMLSQIDKILEETAGQVAEGSEQMSEYLKRMLDVMEYDVPYTATAIMDMLGLKSKETFRKNYMNPALGLNLVKMTIPDKPNSRNQRYIKY